MPWGLLGGRAYSQGLIKEAEGCRGGVPFVEGVDPTVEWGHTRMLARDGVAVRDVDYGVLAP